MRPDGWDADEGAHNALRDNNSWLEDEHTACYEAGADAMLEGLKKDGEYIHNNGLSPYGFVLGRTIKRGEKGYLAFIPEE